MHEQDAILLRRFEPIVRFTQGEQFFPMDVEAYVKECSLLVQHPGRDATTLIPQGDLTLDDLGKPQPAPFGSVHFLKFIEPLNLAELASERIRQGLNRLDPQDTFRAGRGRLARVGYTSRLIDALFQLTLVARGRVPGDTATSARISYRRIMGKQPQYHYHGRVVRQNGWLVLQYWFFYAFNNWRSGFFGANDHEADWEMICIYLSETNDGDVSPEWVAYAAHDFHGDDLRRHWTDPELERIGDHPIIYAGAGSHASYYTAGEYLTEIDLPFLSPLVRASDWAQRTWQRLMRQAQITDEDGEETHGFNVFRIPFVDYARGDGLSIGPGQEQEWQPPHVISPAPHWATQFRGLWGLYARDPLSGEDAPAGPRYNRDGSVRRAWYDPLGWAGLDKVPPPVQELALTIGQRDDLIEQQKYLADQIDDKHSELVSLGISLSAMRDRPHLRSINKNRRERIAELSKELDELRADYSEKEAILEALVKHIIALKLGKRLNLRGHIRRVHRPETETTTRQSRLAEIWAAISIGLAMIVFVVLFIVDRSLLPIGLATFVILTIFIEATFRRRLPRLIIIVTALLTLTASIVLLIEFFWIIVLVSILGMGAYLTLDNLRELRP